MIDSKQGFGVKGMNANHRLKSAVANIKDELERILAVVDVREFDKDESKEDFKNQIVREFNTKLREMKTRNHQLSCDNKRLRERVRELEAGQEGLPSKARATKSEGSILETRSPKKPKLRPHDENNDQVKVLSSPLKSTNLELQPKHTSNGKEITSSQFNLLPTQYSNGDVLLQKPANDFEQDSEGGNLNSSPVKSDFIHEDNRIVGDSQDEFDAFDENVRSIPRHYTALQRIEFLRSYYRMKLLDSKYSIDLSRNPITEKDWAADDFKPNGSWRRPKIIHSHAGLMTKAQEKNYKDFFDIAGYGARVNGPVWDTQQEVHTDEGEELVESQIMDKYLSPPNFMVGTFPNTQERKNQRAMAKDKAHERLQRRVQSATKKPPGEFVFYEEILNQYVAQGRFKV